FEGDIRDHRLLEKLFGDYEIRRVFHAAAKAGVRPSIQDPLGYEAVNVQGTVGLLETASKRKVESFVFASSSSVYGMTPHLPFAEDEPLGSAASPYGATKQAGEVFCATYHLLYRLPVIGLRFFTVYGPRQRPEMAIHKFCRLIDQGQPVPLYGDGTSRRDYTYIDDAVDGVLAALSFVCPADGMGTGPSGGYTGPSGRETGPSGRDTWCEMVNIGEAQTIELKGLITLLEEGLGKKAVIRHQPPQPGDVPATHADVRKAQRLLGYHPRTDIREGIQQFIEWYRREGREMLP
ncbi:MAG TPA: NAD-dependent epimerase/dehydratase family protein, partial [Nitrospiria bacterium]|nr:NAD-dependent epimerase/dehydratase family protein [Nitrospiria bacterium]